MGIAVIDAETDSQVAPLGSFFRGLGKVVFSICDQQTPAQGGAIAAAVDVCYESPEASFEQLVLKQTDEMALRRFALQVVAEDRWPPHLAAQTPHATSPPDEVKEALRKYLEHKKGTGEAAALLSTCEISEMPKFIVEMLEDLQGRVEPLTPTIPPP